MSEKIEYLKLFTWQNDEDVKYFVYKVIGAVNSNRDRHNESNDTYITGMYTVNILRFFVIW